MRTARFSGCLEGCPGGCLPGGSAWRVCPGGVYPHCMLGYSPSMDRITDRCKIFTLSQTSFAGGNYKSNYMTRFLSFISKLLHKKLSKGWRIKLIRDVRHAVYARNNHDGYFRITTNVRQNHIRQKRLPYKERHNHGLQASVIYSCGIDVFLYDFSPEVYGVWCWNPSVWEGN